MQKTGWMRLFEAAAAGLLLLMLTSCGAGGYLVEKYEERTVPVDGSFDSIHIDVRMTDVTLSPSPDETCLVELYELPEQRYSVAVQDGVLTVRDDDAPWYKRLSLLSVGSAKVTVFLPEETYTRLTLEISTGDTKLSGPLVFDEVDIEGGTGDVSLSDLRCEGDVSVTLSTGDVELTGLSCENLIVTGSTGDDTLKNVTVAGGLSGVRSTGDRKMTGVSCGELTLTGSTGDDVLTDVISSDGFSIERSTGDIRLERCDAAELFLKTTTGDITGSLLTGKIFDASTDTGEVNIPEHDASGGSCKATAGTGDIRISVP